MAQLKVPSASERAQLPADGGNEFNRLIHESSPYLLQHARNPVDWYPWGEAAFEKAQRENRPIFLSVGYSTCHWCHVMEHESFENDEVAEVLNNRFVPVKVDREERPDIDDIYMKVTQMVSGRGGWPNSVWLTPELRPWYAGTYFPLKPRDGFPGFRRLLDELAHMWSSRRSDIEEQASRITDEIERLSLTRDFRAPVSAEVIENSLTELERNFDLELGGFGSAPKFPPHGALELCEELLASSDHNELASRAEPLVAKTLEAMARGGLCDQIGGGFHRYSTDQRWLLPHFEKMLYDNAPLARAYAAAYARTQSLEFERASRATYEWVLRELRDPGGAFHSAYDADSEGEEGRFYIWSRGQFDEVLGDEEGEWTSRVLTIRPEGNFRDEATGEPSAFNVPHLSESPETLAEESGLSLEAFWRRLAQNCESLREARSQREWPLRDDKVLCAWNGQMIASLARGGRDLEEPRYLRAAEEAADFLLKTLRTDSGLHRVYREGETKVEAYLEDYANLAWGLLELGRATQQDRYRTEAKALAQQMVERFWDPDEGGFFAAREGCVDLLVRGKDPFDQAVPSGNGMAVRVLVALADEEPGYFELAEQTFEAFGLAMNQYARATETLILAYVEFLKGRKAQAQASNPAHDPTPAQDTAPAHDKAPNASFESPDAQARSGQLQLSLFASQLAAKPGEQVELLAELAYPESYSLKLERFDCDAGSCGVHPVGSYDEPGVRVERLRLDIAHDLDRPQSKVRVTARAELCTDRHCLPATELSAEFSLLHESSSGDLFRHEARFRHADAQLGQQP